MAVTKEKKEQVLSELKAEFKGLKSMVFTQNSGLSVKDMTALRRALRAENVSFHVAKKTLIRLAAKDAGFDEIPDSSLEGPIGVAISQDDEVVAARLVHQFSKGHENVKITGGIVDGNVLSASEMMEIATIPSKEELYAKLVGSMNAPVSGFYNVLHGVLSGFVRTLNAVAQKQS